MVGVYFSFGTMVLSIPPMVDEVIADLGMSRGVMGLILAAWTTLYIVTAPLAGRFVDRLGLQRSIALGGLSLALSALARAAAQGTVTLWFAVAIMGVGGPLVSAAAPKLCAEWFADEAERRRAVSLYNLGPGTGSIVTLYATNSVLLPVLGSWRAVLVAHGVLALVLTGLWWVLAQRAPELPATDNPLVTASTLNTWRLLLGSPGVRYALALGALGFFVGHGMNNWLPKGMSSLAGISITASSNWVATAGLIGMASLFVVPNLATRFGRPTMLTVLFSWSSMCILLVAFGSAPLVISGVLLLGLRATMVPLMIMSLMDADGVTSDNMGAANGLWFSAAQVGAVIGPPVMGWMSEQGGGFQSAFVLPAVVCAVAAVLIQVYGRVSARTSSGTA